MSKESRSRVRKQEAVKLVAKPKHRNRWYYTQELEKKLKLFFLDDLGIISRMNHES